MKFTPEQELAIKARDKNILVSASAGSGKTSVMIERIVQIILNGEAEINEILATTFTRYAADQIKNKLSRELKKACKTNPSLARQLDQLPYANISTIHSFCNNMLKSYFYKLELDANFKIIEPVDEEEYKSRALDRVFTLYYENKDQNFLTLLKKLIHKRTDSALREIVLTLYDYIVSEANPNEYLQKSLEKYTPEGLEQIKAQYMADLKNDLKTFVAPINALMEEFGSDDKGVYPMLANMLVDVNLGINAKNFDELTSIIHKYELTRKTYKTSLELMEAKGKAKVQRDLLYLVYEHIGNFYDSLQNVEYHYKTADDFKSLIRIVEDFTAEYKSIKSDAGVIDFADLEQLMIKLLEDEEVVEDIRGKFKFIFVDEYQDVNPAQEYIIKKISNDNLFLVGDVKQAIYGFRGSDSDLFVATEKDYKQGNGIFIELNKNFRSARAVIDGVNNIFSTVMRADSGVDYASRQMVYGEGYGEHEGSCSVYPYYEKNERDKVVDITEVYDLVKHAQETFLDDEYIEGNIIANIIKDSVGRTYYDLATKSLKRIQYKDIVILSRGLSTDAEKLARRLATLGIMVEVNNKNCEVVYPEISMLTEILRLIVNFNSDTALVSALKSPMGRFSEKELIEIKKNFKYDSFVEAFNKYSGELDQKISQFKQTYAKLRLCAEMEDASQVIGKIFSITPTEAIVGAQMYGDEKLKRMYKFMETGKGYTVDEYLDRLSTGKLSFNLESQSADSVKIMTMHSSKGLEFPVVILAGCGKAYNTKDLAKTLIFDRTLGVAFTYFDETTKTKYTKLPYREYVKYKLKRKLAREEMRLFYVATTRAKYNLFVVGQTKEIRDGFETNEIPFMNHYIDYIKSGDMALEEINAPQGQQSEQDKLVICYESDEVASKKIAQTLAYLYPYKDDIPIKSSVTGVSFGEKKIYEVTNEFGETSAEKGTAYHRFLELWDFKQDWKEFYKTSAKENMLESEYELLDESVLEKICSMREFSTLKNFALYKEKEFIVGVPYNLLADSESTQEVVIQGTMDLLAVSNEKAIVFDYKYSSIKEDKNLAEKYRKQLALYVYAVEKLLNIPTEAHLINIYSQKIISYDKDSLNLATFGKNNFRE